MKVILKLITVVAAVLLFTDCKMGVGNAQPALQTNIEYACIPCGYSCDTIGYSKPGKCTSCMMELVEKNSIRISNIVPDDLCGFIKEKGNENVIIIDVRTAAEFNGTAPEKFGRLAGAINFPVQQLEINIAAFEKYKSKNIIVYCSHSHRSPRAAYILMQHGFTNVTNMQYGMSEWKNKVSKSICTDSLYVSQ